LDKLGKLDDNVVVDLPTVFLLSRLVEQRAATSGECVQVPLEFVPATASWVIERAARRVHLEFAHLRSSVAESLSNMTGLWAFDLSDLTARGLLNCVPCDRRRGFPHRWSPGANPDAYTPLRASFVGEHVAVDSIHMPLSARGNRYIISWIDFFRVGWRRLRYLTSPLPQWHVRC
jgi:hypothetical protein